MQLVIFALSVVGIAAAAGTANASLLISELFYDAVGSDDGLSFVELSGTPGESLDGITLEGINGSNGAVSPTVTLSGVIPADGIFVVADERSDGSSDVAADLFANFDFQNGPDSVVLQGPVGVLDALGYGVFAIGEIFAGEGSPADDPAAGSSLARFFADVDTNDNAFDFIALDTPTPGVAVFAVPEPSTTSLLVVGGAGLAWLGRGRRQPKR